MRSSGRGWRDTARPSCTRSAVVLANSARASSKRIDRRALIVQLGSRPFLP